MSEDRDRTDNVEIEPLSDEELGGVAGGNSLPSEPSGSDTSTGPSCCSCTSCSPRPT